MSDELLVLVKQEIETSIKTHVNGKIDKLTLKLDEHIEQHEADTQKLNERFDPESDRYILRSVMPVIEAYQGSKMFGEALKWLGGVGIGYLTVKKILFP